MKEFCAAASQYSQAKAELRNIETRLAYGAHKASSQPSAPAVLAEHSSREEMKIIQDIEISYIRIDNTMYLSIDKRN